MDARASFPVVFPVENPTVSYWHDPPSKLADHRSTSTLPEVAENVIVGSGISGTMIAWNLLEAGEKDVLLFEARSAVGGATGRNGRLSWFAAKVIKQCESPRFKPQRIISV